MEGDADIVGRSELLLQVVGVREVVVATGRHLEACQGGVGTSLGGKVNVIETGLHFCERRNKMLLPAVYCPNHGYADHYCYLQVPELADCLMFYIAAAAAVEIGDSGSHLGIVVVLVVVVVHG